MFLPLPHEASCNNPVEECPVPCVEMPEQIDADIGGADGDQDRQDRLLGEIVIGDGDGDRIEMHDLPAELKPGHIGLFFNPFSAHTKPFNWSISLDVRGRQSPGCIPSRLREANRIRLSCSTG